MSSLNAAQYTSQQSRKYALEAPTASSRPVLPNRTNDAIWKSRGREVLRMLTYFPACAAAPANRITLGPWSLSEYSICPHPNRKLSYFREGWTTEYGTQNDFSDAFLAPRLASNKIQPLSKRHEPHIAVRLQQEVRNMRSKIEDLIEIEFSQARFNQTVRPHHRFPFPEAVFRKPCSGVPTELKK